MPRRLIQADHQFTPWHQLWRQPLAALVRMPWPVFFACMGLIYVLEVLLFAGLFQLDRAHLVGRSAMGVPAALAISVGSFFANNFTEVEPNSLYTHHLAVVELVSGLITLSTLTAVVFSRLDRPEAPLRFSRHLCISQWEGGHLWCRFVTADPSQWLNVSYSLTLLLDEELEPGCVQRRVHELPLLNARTPQLSQTATLTHRLDRSSILRSLELAELQRRNAVLMAMVEGIHESTGSGLLQTHAYRPTDLLIGQRFADLVSSDPHGRRRIEPRLLNHTVPA